MFPEAGHPSLSRTESGTQGSLFALHDLDQILVELQEAAVAELAGVHHLVHLAGQHCGAPELSVAQGQAEALSCALNLGNCLGACSTVRMLWHNLI